MSGQVPAWSILMATVAAITSALNDVEPQLHKLSLDHKTLFMLSVLDQHDQPSALARALCTPRPTITALIKRAEAIGFIRRHSVPGDLRRFRLSMTDSGRKALAAGRAIVDQAFAERLLVINVADRAAFGRAVLAMAAPGA